MTDSQIARNHNTSVANSQMQVGRRAAQGEVTWAGPVILLVGRTLLTIAAQALVAVSYLLRGRLHPWNAAAPWWTVYGTLVDAGCLILMVKFSRREGLRLRDLVGPIRFRWGYDPVLGIACFLVFMQAFSLPGLLASKLVFGTTHPSFYPGLLTARTLPSWAMIYSFGIWWIIWSPTEEMTYNGYTLPRLAALTRSKILAVMLVSFWWALQHSFIPFVLDWKYVIWRFLFFLPGAMLICLLYLRIRRLAPLILAHWAMDLMGAYYTLSF